MNELTREWIDKAEGDYRTASREKRVTRGANYDAVCFHSQQCAEKYLKAFLQERNIKFEKTHNLVRLLQQCTDAEGIFELIRPDLESLNTYAVDVRYPRTKATKEDVRDAFEAASRVRRFVRARLSMN